MQTHRLGSNALDSATHSPGWGVPAHTLYAGFFSCIGDIRSLVNNQRDDGAYAKLSCVRFHVDTRLSSVGISRLLVPD